MSVYVPGSVDIFDGVDKGAGEGGADPVYTTSISFQTVCSLFVLIGVANDCMESGSTYQTERRTYKRSLCMLHFGALLA